MSHFARFYSIIRRSQIFSPLGGRGGWGWDFFSTGLPSIYCKSMAQIKSIWYRLKANAPTSVESVCRAFSWLMCLKIKAANIGKGDEVEWAGVWTPPFINIPWLHPIISFCIRLTNVMEINCKSDACKFPIHMWETMRSQKDWAVFLLFVCFEWNEWGKNARYDSFKMTSNPITSLQWISHAQTRAIQNCEQMKWATFKWQTNW